MMSGSSDVPLISDSRRGQRVWFREPIVLIPVLCLMFLSGVTTAVEDAMLKVISTRRALSIWKLCHTIIPVPSLYLFMFLSNYTGRKPVIILLFLLSILTSILHSLPPQGTWLLLAFMIQGFFKGGTIAMTFLATWEYSSSKSKLNYLLANAAVWQTAGHFTKTVLYRGDMVENDSVSTRVFPVVLGLVCLGLTWLWPESPYWLASKGRVEESRTAFLWLHGEEGEGELQRILQASPDPGPPKLFSLSLLITILTLSLYKITDWYKSYTGVSTSFNFISEEFKTGFLVCSAIFVVCCTAFILNNFKRKIVLLAILGLLAAFSILRGLEGPIAVEPNPTLVYVLDSISSQISKSGPILICLTFIVWTVPQKYRTFAYACVSFVYLGISAMVLILVIKMSYS